MSAAQCCCVRVLYFSTNIVFMSGVDMTRNHGSEQERQYLVHSVLCDIEVTLTQLESGSRGNTGTVQRGIMIFIWCHAFYSECKDQKLRFISLAHYGAFAEHILRLDDHQ